MITYSVIQHSKFIHYIEALYSSDIYIQMLLQIIMSSLSGVLTKFYEEYNANTPKKLKIIDAYLTYIFFTGVVQFVYCCLVGTFPFNAFLSGFISSVASFVLGVCLRLQVTESLLYTLTCILEVIKDVV